MSEGVFLLLDENRRLKQEKAGLEAKLRMLDELADEILILQSPEAMRNIARFIQEVIKQ